MINWQSGSAAYGALWVVGCLTVGLSLPSRAQTGPGSQLTSTYSEWVAWSKKPTANDVEVVRQWVGPEPKFQRLFTSVTREWEGEKRGTHLCPNTARIARVTVNPATRKATLFICLRSIDLYRETLRAFYLVSIAESAQYREERLAKLYGRYIDYIRSIVLKDVTASVATQDYNAFCTVEYFVLVGLLGRSEPEACADPDVMQSHRAEFYGAIKQAFFLPPALVKQVTKLSGESIPELSERHFRDQQNSEWHRLWIFPVLHELGHLARCHQGPVAGTACTTRMQDDPRPGGLHDPGTLREIEADAWAIEVLVKNRSKDAGELGLDLGSALGFQLLSALTYMNVAEGIKQRMTVIGEQMRKSFGKAIASPDLSLEQKNVLKRFLDSTMGAK